ncbi:DUF5717 family protein [Oribacterium sp. FC2011]|uniref:DUF5717 family protein n=1 Tax=Oribacterium sp. FC2011 TaxID=1408311 RepID=UPI0004E1F60A|nr:DUF5717 family protein [Oribacterium sp. FC2011]
MKERINKLARGIVEIDRPLLKLSDKSFKGTVDVGELTKFDLIIYSENGILLKGLIYSDNPAVTVQKDAFGGIRSRIKCSVDTHNLQDGDKIDGQLCIVSNGGEFKLPYSFDVCSSHKSGELISRFETKEDFIDFCKKNPDLSKRVFDYSDFENAPFMRDSGIYTIYRGLRRGHDRNIALKQFLRALGFPPEQGSGTDEPDVEESIIPDENEPEKTELFPLKVNDKPLIEKAASICIREGATDKMAFDIYQRAIEMGSTITRLYEYYVYAMPKGYKGLLPREVYLYFAYERSIEENMKLPLYYNVIVNFKESDDIYQRFEHRIQSYAIDMLLKSEFNQRLSVIYDRMILADMIDERIASVFPAILHSYRLTTNDRRLSYVVVKYRELDREEVYALKEGNAYIPIFFENSELLFQDAYGNRYTDVVYETTRIMHKEELERKCFEILPEHAMLKLSRARNIANKGIADIAQLRLLEQVMTDMDISKPYRTFLNKVILDYHQAFTKDSDKDLSSLDIRILKNIDLKYLDAKEKDILLCTYIKLSMFKEAYKLILEIGETDIEMPYLEKLIKALIIDEQAGESKEIMMLALRTFRKGSLDMDILNFLLREYNGHSKDMLELLRRGQKAGAGINDMAERLLAQMIFCWADDDLDEVYHIYRHSSAPQNVLIRAYITKRCIDYFLYRKNVSEEVFHDVYGIIHDERYKEKVPVIYLLSMSKYMSENRKLTGEEKYVLQEIVDILIQKKLVFPYIRTLSDIIRIPDSVMDRYYVEYHGEKSIRPSLYLRILPDERDFEEVEISRVYQNIYVRPVTLFSGERAEYQIYDEEKGEDFVESGTIKADNKVRLKGDTFDIINEMSGLLGQDNDCKLRDVMLRYVKNESVIDELFTKELDETNDKEQ